MAYPVDGGGKFKNGNTQTNSIQPFIWVSKILQGKNSSHLRQLSVYKKGDTDDSEAEHTPSPFHPLAGTAPEGARRL